METIALFEAHTVSSVSTNFMELYRKSAGESHSSSVQILKVFETIFVNGDFSAFFTRKSHAAREFHHQFNRRDARGVRFGNGEQPPFRKANCQPLLDLPIAAPQPSVGTTSNRWLERLGVESMTVVREYRFCASQPLVANPVNIPRRFHI